MKKLTIISILVICFMTSCGTSYLKSSTNVTNTKKSYDKIMVIAKAKDKTARINFENQVVKDLAAQGINAETSLKLINSDMFEKELTQNDLDEIRSAMIKNGVTGVIVTHLLSADQYTDVNEGGVGTTYYPVRYGRFGRYVRAYPVNYWEPDDIEVGMEYTLETCLYDLRETENDNLQWVGRFKVKDPNDLMKTIEKYSLELTTELMNTSISN